MMKLLMTLIAFGVMVTAASAQDISIKMDEIAAGSYVITESANGRAFQIYRGAGNGGYVVDHVVGSDPNAPWTSRMTYTADGNMMRRERASDTTIRYEPHNCQRVTGQCQFVEIGPDYRTTMVRINTPTRTGFTFQQFAVFDDGSTTLIREGQARNLDEMGNFASATSTWVEVGHSDSIRQVQAVYR